MLARNPQKRWGKEFWDVWLWSNNRVFSSFSMHYSFRFIHFLKLYFITFWPYRFTLLMLLFNVISLEIYTIQCFLDFRACFCLPFIFRSSPLFLFIHISPIIHLEEMDFLKHKETYQKKYYLELLAFKFFDFLFVWKEYHIHY